MTRLLSPIAVIKIGGDTFQTGDGRLLSASVTLGEDRRASQCSFSLADPELLIAQKYFQTSFTQGGLKVPRLLLGDPTPVQTGGGATGLPSGFSGGSKNAVVTAIVQECLRQGVTDQGQIAYVLATAEGESQFILQSEQGKSGTYRGRGYAQLTSKTNYEKYSKIVGQDLVGNPELANKPAIALFILVHGMRTGNFTGKSLGNYISGSTRNFIAARKIMGGINPSHYATLANKWLPKIPGLSGSQLSGGAINQAAGSASEAQSEPAAEEQVADHKGTSIEIGLGYSFDQLVYFSFVHTGTTASGRSPDTVTFEGQSVRWLMTRRKKNTSYSSISLKQLATKVAQGYGLNLKMDGEGPKYAYLDQTGLSDYGLLLRECNAIGYSIREEGKTLILQPWKANFTGFVITLDIVDELTFTDKASVEANNNAASVTTSTPSTKAGDRKQRIDRLSGKPIKEAKENKKATGSQGTKVSTGSPTKPVTGTAVLPGSETGLPNQKPGAIALSTGRAEAQEILDESRRVKGYESTAKFKTTPEALTLAPGSIIGIDKEIVPPVFSREWRISQVEHQLSSSGMTTSLGFYSPQKQKPPQQTTSTATGSLSPLAGSGTFIRPVQGGRVGDGLGAGRNHKGTDISVPCGSPVYAMAAGVVITVRAGCSVGDKGCNGGAGNYVAIKHSNGIVTRYLHHTRNLVSVGQQVQQGQQVGTVGDTGRSKGCHTHIEFRKGVEYGLVLSPADVGLKL